MTDGITFTAAAGLVTKLGIEHTEAQHDRCLSSNLSLLLNRFRMTPEREPRPLGAVAVQTDDGFAGHAVALAGFSVGVCAERTPPIMHSCVFMTVEFDYTDASSEMNSRRKGMSGFAGGESSSRAARWPS